LLKDQTSDGDFAGLGLKGTCWPSAHAEECHLIKRTVLLNEY